MTLCFIQILLSVVILIFCVIRKSNSDGMMSAMSSIANPNGALFQKSSFDFFHRSICCLAIIFVINALLIVRVNLNYFSLRNIDSTQYRSIDQMAIDEASNFVQDES